MLLDSIAAFYLRVPWAAEFLRHGLDRVEHRDSPSAVVRADSMRNKRRTRADHSSVCWLAHAFCIVALSVFAAQCAPVLHGAFECQGVQIISNELTVSEGRQYCNYAVGERKKVEGFWGATWQQPIRISVSNAHRISRALVPGHFGNRGFMEMPLRRVRDNTGALLHEIVHIYAPNNNASSPKGWPSTFMRN